LNTLLRYAEGPQSLSEAMQASLAKDIISPVLNELHLSSLNRRLSYIVETVFYCGVNTNWENVIINDGF
jgi:hypothetical protein